MDCVWLAWDDAQARAPSVSVGRARHTTRPSRSCGRSTRKRVKWFQTHATEEKPGVNEMKVNFWRNKLLVKGRVVEDTWEGGRASPPAPRPGDTTRGWAAKRECNSGSKVVGGCELGEELMHRTQASFDISESFRECTDINIVRRTDGQNSSQADTRGSIVPNDKTGPAGIHTEPCDIQGELSVVDYSLVDLRALKGNNKHGNVNEPTESTETPLPSVSTSPELPSAVVLITCEVATAPEVSEGTEVQHREVTILAHSEHNPGSSLQQRDPSSSNKKTLKRKVTRPAHTHHGPGPSLQHRDTNICNKKQCHRHLGVCAAVGSEKAGDETDSHCSEAIRNTLTIQEGEADEVFPPSLPLPHTIKEEEKEKEKEDLSLQISYTNTPLLAESVLALPPSREESIPETRTGGKRGGIYSLQHLTSLLRKTGVTNSANQLSPVPKDRLTVELVMAALNLQVFSPSDVIEWIRNISQPNGMCTKDSEFNHQFQQYRQLYQYIISCPQKREHWAGFLTTLSYQLPYKKGIISIFGRGVDFKKPIKTSTILSNQVNYSLLYGYQLYQVTLQKHLPPLTHHQHAPQPCQEQEPSVHRLSTGMKNIDTGQVKLEAEQVSLETQTGRQHHDTLKKESQEVPDPNQESNQLAGGVDSDNGEAYMTIRSLRTIILEQESRILHLESQARRREKAMSGGIMVNKTQNLETEVIRLKKALKISQKERNEWQQQAEQLSCRLKVLEKSAKYTQRLEHALAHNTKKLQQEEKNRRQQLRVRDAEVGRLEEKLGHYGKQLAEKDGIIKELRGEVVSARHTLSQWAARVQPHTIHSPQEAPYLPPSDRHGATQKYRSESSLRSQKRRKLGDGMADDRQCWNVALAGPSREKQWRQQHPGTQHSMPTRDVGQQTKYRGCSGNNCCSESCRCDGGGAQTLVQGSHHFTHQVFAASKKIVAYDIKRRVTNEIVTRKACSLDGHTMRTAEKDLDKCDHSKFVSNTVKEEDLSQDNSLTYWGHEKTSQGGSFSLLDQKEQLCERRNLSMSLSYCSSHNCGDSPAYLTTQTGRGRPVMGVPGIEVARAWAGKGTGVPKSRADKTRRGTGLAGKLQRTKISLLEYSARTQSQAKRKCHDNYFSTVDDQDHTNPDKKRCIMHRVSPDRKVLMNLSYRECSSITRIQLEGLGCFGGNYSVVQMLRENREEYRTIQEGLLREGNHSERRNVSKTDESIKILDVSSDENQISILNVIQENEKWDSDTALVIIENDRAKINSLVDQYQRDLRQMVASRNQLEVLLAQRDKTITAHNLEVEDLKSIISATQTREEEARREKERLQVLMKEMEREGEDKNEALKEVRQEREKLLEELEDKTSNITIQQEEARREEERLQVLMKEMEREREDKNEALKEVRQEREKLLEELKDKTNNITIQQEEARREKERLQVLMKEMEREGEDKNEALKEVRQEREKLLEELEDKTNNITIQQEEARREKERLQVLMKEMEREGEDKNEALKEVRQEREKLLEELEDKTNNITIQQEEARREEERLQVLMKEMEREREDKNEALKEVRQEREKLMEELKDKTNTITVQQEEARREEERLQVLMKEMEREREDKNEALKEVRQEREKLMEELKDKTNTITVQQEELHQLGTSLDREEQKSQAAECSIRNMQEKVTNIENKAIEMMEKITITEEQLREVEEARAVLENQVGELQASLAEKTKQLEENEMHIDSLQARWEEQEATYQQQYTEMGKLQEAIAQQVLTEREHLSVIEEREKLVRSLREAACAGADKLREMEEVAKEEITSRDQDISSLKKEKEVMKRRLQDADKKIFARDQEILVIENTKAEMEVQIQGAKDIIARKEKELSSMRQAKEVVEARERAGQELLSRLHDKDRQLRGLEVKLDLAIKAKFNMTKDVAEIQAGRILLREELKLGDLDRRAPFCLNQEVAKVQELTTNLEEEKQRFVVTGRELLQERARNKTLGRQLKEGRQQWQKQEQERYVERGAQTILSIQEINSQLENTHQVQEALLREQRLSQTLSQQLKVSLVQIQALAAGLRQELAETCSGLEHQLAISSWVSEAHRNKQERLDQLLALTGEQDDTRLSPGDMPHHQTSP